MHQFGKKIGLHNFEGIFQSYEPMKTIKVNIKQTKEQLMVLIKFGSMDSTEAIKFLD